MKINTFAIIIKIKIKFNQMYTDGHILYRNLIKIKLIFNILAVKR